MSAIERLKQALNFEQHAKKEWVRLFDQMTVHSRKRLPESLIKTYRPNEPKEIFDYRISRFEPITHGNLNDAIIRSSKVVHHNKFSYDLSEELGEYLEDKYLYEFDALSMSDDSYFSDLIFNRFFRFMCETGNGLILFLPIHFEDASIPPNEQPQTERVRLGYTIVEPENIMRINQDYGIIRLKNMLWVEKGESKYLHHQYMHFDKQGFIKLVPYYSSEDKIEYREEIWYLNSESIDTVPAVITKGFPTTDEKGNLYYESFFSGFVHYANEAICAFSDDQAVRVINNFPRLEEKEEICDTCSGNGYTIVDDHRKTCTSCKGTGLVVARSPYSSYRKKKPVTGEDAEWAKIPSASYITPPVEAMKHSYEVWQDMLQKADRQVNIKYVGLNQSGVSKDYDREALTDFQLTVSHNFYDNIVYKSLWILEQIFKPILSDRVQPVVNKPTEQDLKFATGHNVYQQINDAKTAGVGESIVKSKILSSIKKMFPDDEVEQYILEVLINYDPLFVKSPDEIMRMKASGVAKNDIVRHIHADKALRKIARSNENFLEMDMEGIFEMIDEALSEKFTDPVVEIRNLLNNEPE